jgi:hypothetical protein
LILGIPLYTQETLLKYIGGLHSYLRHMILMFNPTNLDEVCVQATHIETKGKNTKENFSNKSFKPDAKKFKGKWKSKHTATLKKEGDKPTCTHCQKKGHDASKCWKIHPELKPGKFRKKEDKNTTAAVIQHDLDYCLKLSLKQ